jgi:hypothetical protein
MPAKQTAVDEAAEGTSGREGGVLPLLAAEVPPYALCLVPAVLGGVLGWPDWLSFALLTPGLVYYIRVCNAAARRRDSRLPRHLPSSEELKCSVVGAVATFVVIDVVPARWTALAAVGLWIVVVTPLRRVLWTELTVTRDAR